MHRSFFQKKNPGKKWEIFVMFQPKATESQDLKLDLVFQVQMFFLLEKGVHFLNAKCLFSGFFKICKNSERGEKSQRSRYPMIQMNENEGLKF